jgi:hypothetical protein
VALTRAVLEQMRVAPALTHAAPVRSAYFPLLR